MAVDLSGLSTNPDTNGNVGGINVAEQCPSANLNNAIRWLAAAIATLKALIPDTSSFIGRYGGIFEDNPTRDGYGGYMYNAARVPGGAVYYLPAGSPLPTSAQDGDQVVFFS